MRYIGSKTILLNEIEKVIEKNVSGSERSFLDLFAGTNTVADHFKHKYEVA
ncbi:TPA: DNA adenine methylase, partial [Staphylococcus pseudintermedius]|nr:DNA adenine methylase [Staphylococcus pseudintermedius]